ncbi:hypothetical protein CVO96_19520 [Deinococcus koreensis]|uniref:Uncharacterized protein n=2 Tax=Deinococcus koreensis TaxID=2054903 RepID=A0A2K3US29_9DEIO|nr:hypothetical protein CVO96_19520 [Deinococcus koreensis]
MDTLTLMADPIKVYRTAAFAPLAQDIKRFGALLTAEAARRYDAALLVDARRRKVCAERDTALGPVLYLLHQGRRLAGLAGAFTPTDDGLMNAVCLRDVGQRLEAQGISLDLTARKRSIVYRRGDEAILVLAQHDGYAFAALRRLYKALIDTEAYSEMQLYTYLTPEALRELEQVLYAPARGSRPLDRQRLRLFALPRPDGGVHSPVTLP